MPRGESSTYCLSWKYSATPLHLVRGMEETAPATAGIVVVEVVGGAGVHRGDSGSAAYPKGSGGAAGAFGQIAAHCAPGIRADNTIISQTLITLENSSSFCGLCAEHTIHTTGVCDDAGSSAVAQEEALGCTCIA